METSQPNVSKIEHKDDLLFSTGTGAMLRRLVGGWMCRLSSLIG